MGRRGGGAPIPDDAYHSFGPRDTEVGDGYEPPHIPVLLNEYALRECIHHETEIRCASQRPTGKWYARHEEPADEITHRFILRARARKRARARRNYKARVARKRWGDLSLQLAQASPILGRLVKSDHASVSRGEDA